MTVVREKYLYAKTVKGRDYLYFRAPSGKVTRLPTDRSSSEFNVAYDLCMRTVSGARVVECKDRRKIADHCTIAAAIEKYVDSPEFAKLKPHTLRGYNNVLADLRDALGDEPLCDLDTDRLDVYTEHVTKQNGAATADRVLTVVSKIWKSARKHEQFKIKKLINPTLDAERRYEVKRAHRAWSHEAEQAALAAAPANVRLAILLLHFSAQRGGDVVRMRWDDFDGKGLFVRPEKTNGEAAAEPRYHLCPRVLRDALLAAPRLADTILTNELGRPYKNSGVLSNAIRRVLKAAGITGVSMHGLRKSAARDVAELGVGVAGIKAITGHATDEMAEYYAKEASMRDVQRAAVEQWDAAQERRARLTVVAGIDRKAS